VDGDIGAVQSRIDLHCHPLTPAGKKEQSFRLILCIDASLRDHTASAARSPRECCDEKIFCARLFVKKFTDRRNTHEMRVSCAFASATLRRSHNMRIAPMRALARSIVGAQPNPQRKKNFAQDASAGELTTRQRRKTSESVPTDSRRRVRKRHVRRAHERAYIVAATLSEPNFTFGFCVAWSACKNFCARENRNADT